MTNIKQASIHQSNSPYLLPLCAMNAISSMIDGMLKEVQDQRQNLQEAQRGTCLLDDEMLQQVILLYSEELDFLQIYRQHFSQWELEQPSLEQWQEIARLEQQVDEIEPLLHSILAIADDIKDKTMDLAMDLLMGNLKMLE